MSGEVPLPDRWSSKPWNAPRTATKFPVFIGGYEVNNCRLLSTYYGPGTVWSESHPGCFSELHFREDLSNIEEEAVGIWA